MGTVDADAPRIVGRYALFGPIASGGMATVHFGRLRGPVGFSRVVAIKRLHAHLAKSDLVATFIDEARLAARIRHPNVVTVLDVLHEDGELFLVMDYVAGQPLSALHEIAMTSGQAILPAIASSIMLGVLHGLHAAHEASDANGRPLGLVHRDVSPQNILVATDGTARVVDFGIAKATGRVQTTRAGQVKGKLAYMAPEQVLAGEVTAATDVFGAAIVLWELLAGRRFHDVDASSEIFADLIERDMPPPSVFAMGITPAVDAVVMRALAKSPHARYASAREFALALEAAAPPAPSWRVAEWVEGLASDRLKERAAELARIEAEPDDGAPDVARPAAPSAPPAPAPRAGPQDQTLTDASIAVPPAPRAGPRQAPARRRALAMGFAAAVGIVAALLLWSRSHPRVGAPAASSVRNAPPPPAEPLPPVPVLETPVPPSTGSAKIAPSASSLPRGASPPRPRRPPGGRSCDPPYVEDANGIRYPKPECL